MTWQLFDLLTDPHTFNTSWHCAAIWRRRNGPLSQIPQCICPISHNTPLWNRNAHIFSHLSHKYPNFTCANKVGFLFFVRCNFYKSFQIRSCIFPKGVILYIISKQSYSIVGWCWNTAVSQTRHFRAHFGKLLSLFYPNFVEAGHLTSY